MIFYVCNVEESVLHMFSCRICMCFFEVVQDLNCLVTRLGQLIFRQLGQAGEWQMALWLYATLWVRQLQADLITYSTWETERKKMDQVDFR